MQAASRRPSLAVHCSGPDTNGVFEHTPSRVEAPDRVAHPAPTRIHRHRHCGVLAYTAARREFPTQPPTAGLGRSAPVAFERKRLDRRRSE